MQDKPYYKEKFFKKLSKLFTTSIIVKTPKNDDVKYFDITKLKNNPDIKSNISPTVYKIGTESDAAGRFGFYLPKLQLYRDYESMDSDSILSSALDIYADECLESNTIIPLLNGSKKTIEELYKEEAKNFWIYSLNSKLNKFIPARCSHVSYNGKKEMYEILLEDGTKIKCTSDHIWVTNGILTKTCDLIPGDGITTIPSKISEHRLVGYEMLYENNNWEYKNITEVSGCLNHKIISITKLDGLYDAYDLVNTGTTHIYAIESYDGGKVFCHNCTTRDEYGEMLSVSSDNDDIVQSLENLFYDILDIEFNLWWWVRNVVKYGDFYLKIDITDTVGITAALPLSQYCIQRKENQETGEVTFAYNASALDTQYYGRLQQSDEFYDYEIIHFRMLTDSNYFPYGRSLLESARVSWKQLCLLEDAMLIHRIVRAPDKRVFYLDIGAIEPDKVEPYVQEVMRKMKRMPYVDEATGQYNLRYNVQNLLEDIYIPVRGTESGNRIESLAGLAYDGVIDDVEYIKKRMIAALKVPAAFLGYDAEVANKCIHPKTKIATTAGIKPADRIISEFQNNIECLVYSYNLTTGLFEYKKVIWAGYTRLNTEVIKVVLNNDKYIICTLDHKFLTYDNNWVEAKDLKYGQTLRSAMLTKDGILVEKFYYIKKLEFPSITYDTCDIEIEDNHNFLTDAGVIVHNSTLSAQDIRFSRTINRVQNIILSQLTKIAQIHLLAQGFDVDDLVNFELSLTTSSAIADLEKLEIFDRKANLAQNIKNLEIMPDKWTYQNVFDLSDEEIQDIRLELIEEKIFKAKLEKVTEEGYLEPEQKTELADQPEESEESEADKPPTDLKGLTSGDEEPKVDEPNADEPTPKTNPPEKGTGEVKEPKKDTVTPAEDHLKDSKRFEEPQFKKRKPKGGSPLAR